MEECSRVGHVGCYNAVNNDKFHNERGASHVFRWQGSDAKPEEYYQRKGRYPVYEYYKEDDKYSGLKRTGDFIDRMYDNEYSRPMGLDELVGSGGRGPYVGEGGYFYNAILEAANFSKNNDCPKGCCDVIKIYVHCSSSVIEYIGKSGDPDLLSYCANKNGGKPADTVTCNRK